MAPVVLEEYDYVIVGGGLAGSSVASRLSRCGRVLLVQQSRPGLDGSATQAGLFNPIMAKQGRKVWRAGEALASFRVLVQDVGAEEWVSSGGILRPAMSPKQAKSFQDAARVNPDLCMWKDPEALVDRYPDVLCPFGGLWVQAGGAVNIPRYVDALHHDIVRIGKMYTTLPLRSASGWEMQYVHARLYWQPALLSPIMLRPHDSNYTV